MFQIDYSSNAPIYEQLVRKMKENILKGYLKEGDHLPSVRMMAREIQVTPNTVQKAYRILESEGVIVTMRGKGAFVAGKKPAVDQTKEIEAAKNQLKPGLEELIYLGVETKEILEFVEDFCNGMKEGKYD